MLNCCFCYREKDGKEVSQVDALKGRYEIHDKEHNFIIRDTSPNDDGLYTCSIPETGAKADIHVIGKIHFSVLLEFLPDDSIFWFTANAYLKKVPDNMAVVEGEKLLIHCKALGTDPKITWKIGK